EFETTVAPPQKKAPSRWSLCGSRKPHKQWERSRPRTTLQRRVSVATGVTRTLVGIGGIGPPGKTEEVPVKKVLVTLFLTALLGSAVAANSASASVSPPRCGTYGNLHIGC